LENTSFCILDGPDFRLLCGKGLSFGLPLHTLYGENDFLAVLQQMLYTGNLNPINSSIPDFPIICIFLFYMDFIGSEFGPDISTK
jgi:hypothetical protein